jgi:hypothetical protein
MGKTVLPIITTKAEAQEEANRLNVINLLVIRAKEGAVEAIGKLVGSSITDAILHIANGSNHKSMDDFTLFDVMQVAIDGADRTSTNDVLEQLLKVINHTFDFLQENQRQCGALAIKRSTNGHVRHHHRRTTACAHTFSLKQRLNPNTATNSTRPCTPSARSTRTITCTMRHHSKPF